METITTILKDFYYKRKSIEETENLLKHYCVLSFLFGLIFASIVLILIYIIK